MIQDDARAPVRSTELTRFRLAPNPGPMSLHGTNSYMIAAAGSDSVVVVDPGPLDEEHLRELSQFGAVELVLITHRHADHTAAAARFAELTGAPVRAADPAHCHGGEPLRGGEVLHAAGVEIRVLATPGHTSDSVCFHLPADGTYGAVLTGDTILGVGTTVLDYPDGTLADYLSSLDRLESLGPATVLPAHGPILPALDDIVRAYRDHRQDRLAQIRTALDELGPGAGVHEVADLVYAAVDPSVRPAAELSVAAQLDYLRSLPN
ncbi:MBL fold metallo-hydrolase [Arthrobacter sp. B3I4]|uniref:MBL fold metallo-hydrolase n=1 Tax=Arthrobacter sp. B3I4 TaxID=3042267 RepID=UPI00278B8BB9|nr:MBL fold metallo-hydrolase [Arthrobacter sp. B3I4]MDQ0755972.1 glyoxylase-like metal-dependent hydrolase (beta-lactamase superfamily II) [Arthrobacter sp. B3I4]